MCECSIRSVHWFSLKKISVIHSSHPRSNAHTRLMLHESTQWKTENDENVWMCMKHMQTIQTSNTCEVSLHMPLLYWNLSPHYHLFIDHRTERFALRLYEIRLNICFVIRFVFYFGTLFSFTYKKKASKTMGFGVYLYRFKWDLAKLPKNLK